MKSRSAIRTESAGASSPQQRLSDPVVSPGSTATATPMMAQYWEIKSQYPDCLLFYRMGDFFELFFADAEIASAALNIHLTKRGKHSGEDIPMCGVPIVRAEEYLHKLIAQGHRVAVCEQLENPAEAKKRGGKSVVQRGVVRLVTPGTITEDGLLNVRASNFLTAAYREPGGGFAHASLDISTGEFVIGSGPAHGASGELARLAPSEILLSDEDGETGKAAQTGFSEAAQTPLPRAYFNATAGEAALKSALGVGHLDAFGAFSRGELAAAGALLKYVEITQIGKRPALRPPKKAEATHTMSIDAATRANLELTRSASGAKACSLLEAIDRTLTAAGARALAQRLSAPLVDPNRIAARLDAVGLFFERASLRDQIRDRLKRAPDIARALSRLKLGRGGPRDLGLVRDGLRTARAIAQYLEAAMPASRDLANAPVVASDLADIARDLAAARLPVADAFDAALADELPILLRDGGCVREGFRADLDDARRLSSDGRSVIAGLQAKYVEQTGVKTLKVRHNNVLGYFIEIPASAARVLNAAPHDGVFQHRQTVSNAMRFMTPELAEIEARMAVASERALSIEAEVFDTLAAAIMSEEIALGALAAALGDLDCICALAALAEEQGYVRPVVDGSAAFCIVGGRHPVVEQALKRERGPAFIGNDCQLGQAARLWILTGPNMAGKSTFLRQNAVLAVMAQMGSFVPAASAHIGVVDKLFSRVGASDDLARGRSTFMVEMVETAAILHQATERSLVILDEIGRGTATFDGLSIAWACLEYLHDVNRCRALFATHYHELTSLPGRLPNASNATMAVKEWKDEIVFLHQVRTGAADRSYGVQVAKLAGLPGAVVDRARAVLKVLEEAGETRKAVSMHETLPLFAAAHKPAPQPSPVVDALKAINPDALTPRQALDALYRLKELE
ncbi:MAG: DNA mismatch repair protein MutS [Chitinophagales bacterium]|nr:DNA mismatch repair protein MutS [Hyphomicrobiales bacterium]